MSNKLTPQEKQMPVIRLPLRIAIFAWADLFITLLMCVILWMQSNPAGVFAVGFVMGIPAIAGICIYSNHLICFDKENIIYRNYARKITRLHYEDISEIVITDGKTFLTANDIRIPVNRNDRDSKWLLELAEKKAVCRNDNRKVGDDLFEAKPSPLFAGILIVMGIFFLCVGLYPGVSEGLGANLMIYFMAGFCGFMLIPFFREKHYYNEEKIVMVTPFLQKRKEYYFADLIRAENNYNMCTLHFTNGKYRVSTGMSQESTAHFFNNLDKVFDAKIEAIRAEQGDKAAEEAELDLFARNHGKSIIKRIYGQNLLSDNAIWLVYACLIFCNLILLIPENDYQPGIGEWKFVIIFSLILTLIYIIFITLCRNLHRLPNGLLDIMILIVEPSLECYERMSPEKQDRYRYRYYEISPEEEEERREKALAKGMTEEEYEKEDLHILDRFLLFFARTLFRGNVKTYYPFLSFLGWTLFVSVMAFLNLMLMNEPLDESETYEVKTAIVHVDETYSPLDAGRPIIFIDENDTEYEALRLKAYGSDYDKLIEEANNGTILHFYGAKRDYGMLVYSIGDENGNVYYTKEDAQKAYAKWERSEDFGNAFIFVTPFFWLILAIYFLWLRYPNIAPKVFLKHVIKRFYITETFVERIPETVKEEARAELKKQEEQEKNPPQEEESE